MTRDIALYCSHAAWTGAEGPVLQLGRWPVLWVCDGCGLLAVL